MREGIRQRHTGAAVLMATMLAFLFAPIVIVVLFSFNASPALSFPFAGLSVEWYQRVFEDVQFSRALQRSVSAGLATAVVATPLGVLLAFGLRRIRRRRLRSVGRTVALLPMVVPVLILGIGLAILVNRVGIPPQLSTAVLGHVLVALPFVVLTVSSALDGFPHQIHEAAADLGATPSRVFRSVTLPLIRPAVEGAFLLAMALSIDEFVISLFNAGNDATLPLLIWAKLRRGIDPTINAVATLLIVATVGLALAAARRTARASR